VLKSKGDTSLMRGCGVGGKMSNFDLSKISDSESLTLRLREWSLAVKNSEQLAMEWKSGYMQEFSVSTKIWKNMYDFNRDS